MQFEISLTYKNEKRLDSKLYMYIIVLIKKLVCFFNYQCKRLKEREYIFFIAVINYVVNKCDLADRRRIYCKPSKNKPLISRLCMSIVTCVRKKNLQRFSDLIFLVAFNHFGAKWNRNMLSALEKPVWQKMNIRENLCYTLLFIINYALYKIRISLINEKRTKTEPSICSDVNKTE